MNPETPQTMSDEFESRITALLLGELPPEEEARVRAAVDASPELWALQDRLQHTIGRVREAVPAPGRQLEPKLSAHRRLALLQKFQKAVPDVAAAPRRRTLPWYLPMALAATLMVALTVASLDSGSLGKSKGMAGQRGDGETASFRYRMASLADFVRPTDASKLRSFAAPAQEAKAALAERESVDNRLALGVTLQTPVSPPPPAPATTVMLREPNVNSTSEIKVAERVAESPISLRDEPASAADPLRSRIDPFLAKRYGLAANPPQKTKAESRGLVAATGALLSATLGSGPAGGPTVVGRGGVIDSGSVVELGRKQTQNLPAKDAEGVLSFSVAVTGDAAGAATAEANRAEDGRAAFGKPVDAFFDSAADGPATSPANDQINLAYAPSGVINGALPNLEQTVPSSGGVVGGAGFGGVALKSMSAGRPAVSQNRAAVELNSPASSTLALSEVDATAAVPELALRQSIDNGRSVSGLDDRAGGAGFGEDKLRSLDQSARFSRSAGGVEGGVDGGLGGGRAKMESAGKPVQLLAESRELDRKAKVASEPLTRRAWASAGAATKLDAASASAAPVPTGPGEPLAHYAQVTNRAAAAVPQPEIVTTENSVSTFSLNVTDVSFKLAAASLEKGVLPDPASIRSEEFINAFKYRDPEAASGLPIAFNWERAQYPFAHHRDVYRFAVRTAAQGREAGRPLNLVLLLDNSGSMERADRVAILREALRVLAGQLQAQDRISVVTFARTPRLWVDAVSGDQAGTLVERIAELTPEGGTNLEEALNLAYATAARQYLAAGVNRVVLLTDGAANLGEVSPDALQKKVEGWRQRGVALDCFGIGWEGLNDDLLEVLARHGDGRYGFVNTPEEASQNFAAQLAGALHVAATDVKMQVEFNPQRVAVWRQVGYAKHQLTQAQFRDNTVDAAELAAAESGNALYVVEVNAEGSGPVATVRARFRDPQSGLYRELEWPVPYTGQASPLERAPASLRLAATASAFSEWLAGSPFAAEVTPDRLMNLLPGVAGAFAPDPAPSQLEWMIRQAKAQSGK